ncbi:MAG: endolytic transglycosylase MltG, partial [Patescibacteria group bacterium]
REDTRTPSAYNTYINRGLPPGPISNPGLKAIEAAIYPTENNYNYFLSRPDTKETIFSITYEEHLLNKNKYLK